MYINEYEQKEPSTELKVSKDFLNIYSNFNVVTQVEEMKKLTLIICLLTLSTYTNNKPIKQTKVITLWTEK